MKNLRRLQEQFTKLVTLGPSADACSASEATFIVSDALPAKERISIYADAWFIRLEESLRDDYRNLYRTFEHEAWMEMIESYLKKCPSSSYTLARAGDLMPSFLKEWNGCEEWQLDLALLERAYYKAQNAKDPEVWSVEDLQKVKPEDVDSLSFKLQPSVFLVESNWAIDPCFSGESVKPKKGKTYLVVSRDGFTPEVRKVDADEFRFFKLLADGATLGVLVDAFPDGEWTQWLSSAAASGAVNPIL